MVAAAAVAAAGALQYLGSGMSPPLGLRPLQVSPVLWISAASSLASGSGPGRAPAAVAAAAAAATAAAAAAAPELRRVSAPPRRGSAPRGPGCASGGRGPRKAWRPASRGFGGSPRPR